MRVDCCLECMVIMITVQAVAWMHCFTKSAEPRMAEKFLISHLLADYDRRSRPVVDGVSFEPREGIQQVTVEFGLRLIHILDLNEMDQVLTTSVRSLYRWTDLQLQWLPEEFNSITVVNIPTDQLWLPDISLYNYADERLEERRPCDARVYSNGTVDWQPMAIYKSTCRIHIRYFPFDTQRCHLKFGPWSYDGFRVNISHYGGRQALDLDDYIESPEWKILGKPMGVFDEIKYPCCEEVYPDITFYIFMERQPAFLPYVLILPCFLLSSLTLVLFWLPPETPAKMVHGMNIFVAFFLLLLLLEDTIPSASSTFPLIGTYYCLNMSLITLSTFLSVVIVNFHFRGDSRKEVPHWLKTLALKHGARLLFVDISNKHTAKQNAGNKNSSPRQVTNAPAAGSNHGTQIAAARQRLTNCDSATTADHHHHYHHSGDTDSRGVKPVSEEIEEVIYLCLQRKSSAARSQSQILANYRDGFIDKSTLQRMRSLSRDIGDILKALKHIQKTTESREKANKCVSEWRAVAHVLDRVFFIVYVITIITSIIAFFPRKGGGVDVTNFQK